MTEQEGRYREEQLVLALALGRSEEAAGFAQRANWDRAAALANREMIGGYLHRSIETHALSHLAPPEFLSALARAYRKTAVDNLLLLARLKEAAFALERAGVPVMVLKGCALLEDVYADPGTRALTDADLLVRREDVPAMQRAFEGLGWKWVEEPGVAPRRCEYESPGPGSCVIEIHWDLSQKYRFQADLDRLWKEARPLELDELKAFRLGPDDELVYLSLHYAAHYFGMSVKWLIDLIELVLLRPPDWRGIGERAGSWRGSAALHAALLFVHKCAPAIVTSQDVAAAGRHPILDRLLACYATDDPLRLVRDLPYGPRRLLLAAMFQDRMSDRFALAWLTQVRGHREDD